MRRALLVSILALSLASAGCGGGSSGGDGVSAADVLARAGDAFGRVKTFHFKLDHENGSSSISAGLSLALDTAEGDFVLPDRMSAEAVGKTGPTTLRVRIVAIGDRTWITNPFTREFQSVPVALLTVINPSQLVSAVATSLKDPRIVGTESVDGVPCYRIAGKVRSDDIRDGLGFADTGLSLDVEAWIGKDDHLLRRAVLKGRLLPSEAAGIARVLTLSRFDAAVTIEQPR